jgi:mRNA-degrading endonuclease toxin of MazEF toxin-antitoxin module
VTFEHWQVISVPFPFVEGHGSKRRPALVVCTDAFHVAHHTCFGAMITTARHMQDLRPDDIPIEDLAKAGLPRPCVIRLARVAAFECSEEIHPVGVLSPRERQPVTRLLALWLGV